MHRESRNERGSFAAVSIFSVLLVLAVGAYMLQAAPSARAVVTWQAYADNPYFYPAILQINPGDTITWHNNDSFPHTVTSDSGAWSSLALPGGTDVSLQLTTPGTYGYHCTLHSGMTGTIIVNDAQIPEFSNMPFIVMGLLVLLLGLTAILKKR